MTEKRCTGLLILALYNIPCTCLIALGLLMKELTHFNIGTIIVIACGIMSVLSAIIFTYVAWDYGDRRYMEKREATSVSNEEIETYTMKEG